MPNKPAAPPATHRTIDATWFAFTSGNWPETSGRFRVVGVDRRAESCAEFGLVVVFGDAVVLGAP